VLVLVSPQERDDGARYASQLQARRGEFEREETTVVVTTDAVPKLPTPRFWLRIDGERSCISRQVRETRRSASRMSTNCCHGCISSRFNVRSAHPERTGQRWEHFPHGADIGIRGWGSDVAAAFEQAAQATTAIVIDPSLIRPETSVEISDVGASSCAAVRPVVSRKKRLAPTRTSAPSSRPPSTWACHAQWHVSSQ